MRIACWISNATNTHSEYVTRIAFSLQQLLPEHVSMLRNTLTVCLLLSVELYDAAIKTESVL
jgi:hypothetical protein